MSDQPRPDPPSPDGDDRGSHHSLAAGLSATAHRIEHAVEERVEHGIEVAEQTIVRRFGVGALRVVRRTVRFAFWSLVAAYFAFGALMLVARYYVLPRIDHWRPDIEGIAGRALKGQVAIGRLEAGWRGFSPHLSLDDVQIVGPRGGPPLALPRVEATLSWSSLLSMEPRFAALRLRSPEVSIVRLTDGNFAVAGFVIQPGRRDVESEASAALDWLLSQNRIVVSDARVTYRDDRGTEPRTVDLRDLNLILEQSLGSHAFALNAVPTAALASPIDLRGNFTTGAFARPSVISKWSGEAFAQLDFVDLAQMSQLIELPVQIEHAHGALRMWLAFDEGSVVRTTADVALQDVTTRLGSDLEPLRLASLQGRATQRQWGDLWPVGRGGQEFGLAGTTFRTAAGLTFPPLDMKLRRTRAAGGEPQRTEFEASRIDLESLAALVTHVPLPRELRDNVARHSVRGVLTGLTVAWAGESPAAGDIAVKSRFSGLSSAAQPAPEGGERKVGVPGFENLSGTVRMEGGAGTLELAGADVVLVFPGVFEEPRLPLKQLAGSIHWRQAAALEFRAENLRASNDDVDLIANGTYRTGQTGPGTADIVGRIPRASANSAHRYIPSLVEGGTRRWLEHALVKGRLNDATFKLKGDLARFPFINPADGDFRLAGRVTGATLDVYPAPPDADGKPGEPGAAWPVLSEIDADLLFERASMTITAQRGRAYGARIENTTARIPHLGHDATLDVRGEVSGPLAEMVRYANTSPVKHWIGGITDGAEVQGNAKLDLALLIPLQHATDTKVTGAIAFQNNTLTLAALPQFTRTNGTLNFSERGVRINNLSTNLLGGPARLDASTRADGALLFNATGVATASGLRPAVPVAPVQRLLDRSTGSARYQASVIVKNGTELRIDSDLTGLAIDGLAPLRKSAQDSLPIRVERTSNAEGDDLRVQVARILGVRIERRADKGVMRMTRGVVAINEPANLPERGMLVIGSLPRLDLEAWSDLLNFENGALRSGRAAASTDDLHVDFVALRTPELIVYGHRVQNLTLGATRLPDGGYSASIVSDGASGYVEWRPAADPQSLGSITARLSRLVISANKEKEVVAVLRAPPKQIPSLEVSVEQFEMTGMKLGRLDLLAQNVGSGSNAAWRVRRFDIANADMKLAATGEWAPFGAGGNRRTQLKFGIDVMDGGEALGRLGFPDALSKGSGRVDGEVQWLGSPLDIDYPTLSGRVSLAVDNGRFLKVDTGNAARLLALLSLQALGRNLAADGGRQFTEGFAFSSIRADAGIERGILKTDNFRMNGASAAVLMSGSLDLRNETQQLSIVVLPEIDASTAALAVGVVNPVIGLGTFLAQLVLKDPLSKAFALQYDVTGSWTDPKIARRSRITPTQSPEAAK
ncbi:MAG: YhdP family protein [Burkholderiaceae bacterium]